MLLARVLALLSKIKNKLGYFAKGFVTGHSATSFVPFPGKYMARSHVLKIETTNICNARCSFCAYQYTQREKMYMHPDVYLKAVSDYVSIGGGSIGFTPVVGEFLLDPYLFDRLEVALAEPKITDIGFHTNLLDLIKYSEVEIQKIMASIDWISISTGANAEDYKLSFGVDRFQDILKGLECLVSLKKDGVPMPVIKIEGRSTRKTPDVDPRLKSYTDVLLNGREVCWLQEYGDWGGEIKDSLGDVPISRINRSGRPSQPCILPLLSSVVFSNGDVGLCSCADAHASLVIGNIMQQSLGDILSSKKRTDLILGFMSGQIKPCCSVCTFYQPLSAWQINDWIEWINPHHFMGTEPIWKMVNGQLLKRKR